MEATQMTASNEKLNVLCAKCDHKAGSHNLATGKHECFVYGCDCQWFKIPKENIDESVSGTQTDPAS